MGELSRKWRDWLIVNLRSGTLGVDRTKEAKEGIARLADHLDAAERKWRAAEGLNAGHVDAADAAHRKAGRAREILVGVVMDWGIERGVDISELAFRLNTKTLK